jgi:DNA-binding winged helix-turn-helix (wHTH) protein
VLADQLLSFGPYRFDPGHGQLWRGKQGVKLTLKAIALLRQLVQQAGQVVTKEELFRRVWPDTVVSDTTLTSCILELRQALHDRAKTPRYIETVHRRGYRFIGKVVSSQHSVASSLLSSPTPSIQHPAPLLVGREAELRQLHSWLEKALSGERQIVFVSGEPGIGKTTLVEAFLSGIREGLGVGLSSSQSPIPSPWLGRGQCIEHYGAGGSVPANTGSAGAAMS